MLFTAAYTLPLPTQASETGALRIQAPFKLSRVNCDVAYHTPAWLNSFEDYQPQWLEAATTIRVLQREHEELSNELTSAHQIRNAAKLKFKLRRLQRKNDDLYRLIEDLSPNPGYIYRTMSKQLQWYYYNILHRHSEPLKSTGDKLWVSADQF